MMDYDDTQSTTPNKHNPIVQLQAEVLALQQSIAKLTELVHTMYNAKEQETSTAYLLGYIEQLEKRIRYLEIGPH